MIFKQLIIKLIFYISILMLFTGILTAAEGMPQFNAKSFYSQLFWLILTFTCLYLIVTYILLPRIRENIRLRKNKIANDLERSENIRDEIEQMISQSNSKIEEAKNQVKKMINKSIVKANNDYSSQIETIKKQLNNKQLENEKKLMIYKKSIEKDISKSTISLCAIILNRLKYKNLKKEELEELLKTSKVGENV